MMIMMMMMMMMMRCATCLSTGNDEARYHLNASILGDLAAVWLPVQQAFQS
jgi:hypothetical protein